MYLLRDKPVNNCHSPSPAPPPLNKKKPSVEPDSWWVVILFDWLGLEKTEKRHRQTLNGWSMCVFYGKKKEKYVNDRNNKYKHGE